MERKTEEVLQFAHEFINNGFNSQAAMKVVSPELEGESLRVKASRWINSDQIITAILDQLKDLGVTQEKLKNIFHKVLLTILHDTQQQTGDRIQAIQLLAKLNNMLKDRIDIKTEDITDKERDFVDLQLSRLGVKSDDK